jgi:hypothetical protein
MKYTTSASNRKRVRVQRVLCIEGLETRTLLTAASETFTAPSLTDLITLAESGTDTAGAAINRELSALETQLTDGPLNDLNSGTVDSSGFVQEVQSMEMSYEQDLAQVLSAFPNVKEIMDLGGQSVVADAVTLNQEFSVGLLSSTDLATFAQSAIDSLTAAPIDSLKMALSAYASETQGFEADLNSLAESLSSSATPSLTPSEVSATVLTEADAFFANVTAVLQVTHPTIAKTVENAVNNLDSTATSLAGDDSSAAHSALTTAIAALDTALLGTTGEFGAQGPIAEAMAGNATIAPARSNPQAATVMSAVSGLATAGGTATLTATLNSSSTGDALAGETVNFTLDGVFAGAAVTNSSGVATLSGVPTSDAPGNDSVGVVATFAGNSRNRPSDASGDLLVTQAGTVLTSVSGTASFGGTATLTATLLNPVPDTGIAGETVDFTLDGTSVGSAVTNSSGIATFTGVTTTDAVGTDTSGVVASFAGDANNAAAANGTGSLIVSQAATTLGDVSGTAVSGGTATLTATLTSSATNAGVANETVSFTLDGTSVGSATTNSAGVATLAGVSTSDAVGTHSGSVVASFAGDGNYQATANASGNLVVTT